MKTLRQTHRYLGCIFAPLIIYFSLSGAWQIFRFNDIPKNETPSAVRSMFHELSKPHTNSTLPGANPKLEHSMLFNWIALLMAFGMIITTLMGLVLAFRYNKSPKIVLLCLFAGILLPVIFLFIR